MDHCESFSRSMIIKTQWKCRLIWIMWFFLLEIVGSPLKTGFDWLKNMFKSFSFPTGGGCCRAFDSNLWDSQGDSKRTPKVPRANESQGLLPLPIPLMLNVPLQIWMAIRWVGPLGLGSIFVDGSIVKLDIEGDYMCLVSKHDVEDV